MPICKSGEKTETYKLIYFLSFFSKKCIMPGADTIPSLKYLTVNNIYQKKQTVLSNSLIKYAIIQLVHKLLSQFKQTRCTQGICIGLSKWFDRVDYQVLLKTA